MPRIYDSPEQEQRAQELDDKAGVLQIPVPIGRTDTWVDQPDEMRIGTATIDFMDRTVILPGPVSFDVLLAVVHTMEKYNDVGKSWYCAPYRRNAKWSPFSQPVQA